MLPLAFILGVIALFFPQRRKGQAIAAVIISIIGTVVAVIVFMFVVGDSFNKAFNEETTVSNSGTDSSKQGASRETPLPLGSTLETKDWAVTINSVDLNATEAVMAENQFNEAPTADQTYILVNATIKFKGDEASGSTPMSSIQYVTAEGNSISSGDNLAVAPESLDTLSTLYKDASVTGNMVFAVPAASAAQGVLAVRPDMFSEKKFVAVQ